MKLETPNKRKSTGGPALGSNKKPKSAKKTPGGAPKSPQNNAVSVSAKKGKLNDTNSESPKKMKKFQGTTLFNTSTEVAVESPKAKQESPKVKTESPKVKPESPKKNQKSPGKQAQPQLNGGSGESNKKQKKLEKKNKDKEGVIAKDGGKIVKKKRKRHDVFALKSKLTEGPNKALVKEIQEKIDSILQRKELTKTAKRKLKFLNNMKLIAEGKKKLGEKAPPSESSKRRQRRSKKKNETKEEKKNGTSSSEEEEKQEGNTTLNSENADSDEEDSDIEASKAEAEQAESSDEEDDDDDEEEDDDEEDEDSEEEDEPPKKVAKANQKPQKDDKQKPQKDNKQNAKQDKNQRYVLYVCNLPYDATEEDIRSHFQKAGKIASVRIPKDKDSKPRGFAYIELTDEEAYQKAFSMHQTFIKGRQIKVEYTKTGKQPENAKKQIVAKNAKLHALRKEGKLAGSVKENQKRSFRRKNKAQNA